MKKKVRLTEKDLHNIIENSVYRILQENGMDEKIDWKGNLKRGAIGLGMLGATAAADKLYDINHDDNYDPQEIVDSNRQFFDDERYYDENGRYPADDTIPLYEKRIKSIKEERKPNDRTIGKHKFKGEYYDKNGNPIYTHPSKLDDPDGGTLSDDSLKKMGWKYSKKRGLHGQINDIDSIVKESVKKVLQEGDSDLASQAAGTAARAAAKTRGLRSLFSKKTPEQYAAQSARLRNLAKERRVGAEADYKDAMNRYNGYRDYDNDANAWITKHYSDDELANLRAQFISDKKDENNDIYSKARSGEPIQRGEDGSYVKQGRRLPKFGRGDK